MRRGEACSALGLDSLPVLCRGHRQCGDVAAAETLGNVEAFLNPSSLEVR